MGVSLRAVQQKFVHLMVHVQSSFAVQFVAWLDEKVCEFKINGMMDLDLPNSCTPPQWIANLNRSLVSDRDLEYGSETTMTETVSDVGRTILPSEEQLRRKRPFNATGQACRDAVMAEELIEEADASMTEKLMSSATRATQGRRLRKTPRKNPRYLSDYLVYSDTKPKYVQSCVGQKTTATAAVSSTVIEEETTSVKNIDKTCIVTDQAVCKETNLLSYQCDDADGSEDNNNSGHDNLCVSDTDNSSRELQTDIAQSIKVISQIIKQESSSEDLLQGMQDDVQDFPETAVEGALEDGNIDGFTTIYAVIENSNNGVNVDNFEYCCSECKFKSHDITELFAHQKLHLVKGESEEMEASEHVGDRHICDKCGKSFGYTQSLKNHIRTIHERSIELCPDCGKRFVNKHGMIVHMKQVHGSGGQYKCTICDRRFERKVYYSSHMRRHLGYKPFECNRCGKHFFWKHSVITHLEKCGVDLATLSAKNEAKPQFICNVCGQCFTRKGAYNSHMKRHSDPKIFQCGQCQKLYNWKHNLLMHMKKCGSSDGEAETEANEFQCHVCSRMFKRKVYYDSHMRRHRGQKPFQCELCEKRFYWKHGLTTHMMKCGKTEEELKAAESNESKVVTEFSCHICGLVFNRESSLKVHVKGKHQTPQYKCNCGKMFAWPSVLAHHKMKCLTAGYPVLMEENAAVWTEDLI